MSFYPEIDRLPQIPPDAEKWVKLHRTSLQGSGKDLLDAYWESLKADLAAMEQYLPKRADSVLDIGCGLAGFDILLSRLYQPDLEVYLLDGSGEAADKFGFRPSMEAYNDMGLAVQFLEMNGVTPVVIPIPSKPIDWLEAFPEDLDLVISLLSWGHHYPVHTYLEQAVNTLKPGGRLILDVRRGHGGFELLRSHPALVEIGLVARHKSERWCFQRIGQA